MCAVPSDKDLLKVMMSRLTHLEKRVQLQAMEIAEKVTIYCDKL